MVTTETFPAIGHVYEARFGELAFHLQFDANGSTMRFAPADAPDFAEAEAVTYRATAIRACVFMVTWSEADGTTVTHVEDFENGIVHTNITKPDHSFLNLSGGWSLLT
ncbi:hypothetical protein FJ987_00440 [Mesorhizobium sp. CU2]|uniref:MoaF-related domain-containing protein n=1 Tax=unclassified Mesorhizobium TaxID=325217 RepID=UPI00112645B2|nr:MULTISPECIES: hypothetical protein [unclassified Mesorhizobium]TPN89432.1 hypothetical protein FJ988_00480 [Mesorhizobium sp. CU3]TPO22204.1 hypothetical protein FJ987_00440 [Mesorhizobium sp. CU2]